MFCSKCGKTLKPGADACPFCGAPVGESRFEGNGYTAAQPRFVSAEAGEVREATPYTRTTYTSMQDSEQEGDIYSRTTYRPILKDQGEHEGTQTENVDTPNSDVPESTDLSSGDTHEQVSADEPKGEPQPVLHVANAPVSDTDEEEPLPGSIVIAPLKPIKKTGISPEVEQYIRRMNEQKSTKRQARPLFGSKDSDAAPEDELDKLAAEAAAEGDAEAAPDSASASEDTEAPARRARSATSTMPRFVKPAAAILCILVILGVAAYALIQQFKDSSILEGVGYNLREKGIALIDDNTSQSTRLSMISKLETEMASMSADDGPYTIATKQMLSDIEALRPETPQKNDTLFVDTLVKLQEAINNAYTYEMTAKMSNSDPTQVAKAEETWDGVFNAVTKLKSAKEAVELEGVMNDAVNVSSTPAPTEPPPEDKYPTLKRGMNNNNNVKKLQLRLEQLGYFKSRVDKDFGQVTQIAVKNFQEKAGLEVTGIADSATQEALYAEDAPRNTKSTATPAPEGEAPDTAAEPTEPPAAG